MSDEKKPKTLREWVRTSNPRGQALKHPGPGALPGSDPVLLASIFSQMHSDLISDVFKAASEMTPEERASLVEESGAGCCSCGWRLPLAVMPMRSAAPFEDLDEDAIVPGACVSLVCPTCAKGHAFYSPHEAKNADAETQRRLGIKT